MTYLHKNRILAACLLLLALSAGSLAVAQTTGAGNNLSGAPDAQDVISYLNQTIVWYRQLTVQQEIATEPSDIVFLNQNRQLADQVVRLSFDFARAEAQLLAQRGVKGEELNSNAAAPGRYQSLVAMTAKADQQVKAKQQELAALQVQLAAAAGRKRGILASTVAETQSELDLLRARRDSLRSMIEFVSGRNVSGLSSGSLQNEIEDLARAVPAAATDSGKGQSGQTVAVSNSNPRKAEPTGILALLTELFGLRRRVHTLDQGIAQTAALATAAKNMRTPLVNDLKDLIKRGDQLSNQPDSSDQPALAQQKQQLDQLTAQFKQLSGVVLPLGKQGILLDL